MNHDLIIGIDLGGTRVKAGLIDSEGNRFAEHMEPSVAKDSLQSVIGQLATIVGQLTRQADGGVGGIGLGVAGLVDVKRQIILTSPNCHALDGVQLGAVLGDSTGYPVKLDNDANVMALGEGACGAARGSRHYICITLGTGVGGAVVTRGRLIRGFTGGGGELGHIPIARSGARCGCGSRGCLETFVGRAGIDRYIDRKYPHHSGKGLKELNRLALDGDSDSVELFAYIGRTLAIGLAGLVNVFNPELIVIGGGVAAAGNLLFVPLEIELRKRAFKAYLEGLQVRPAELGNWAGVVGAAQLMWR